MKYARELVEKVLHIIVSAIKTSETLKITHEGSESVLK